MQQPEHYLGTWHDDATVNAYANVLQKQAIETWDAQDRNRSYDFVMKQFGRKCEGCEHYHAVLWESRMGERHSGLCWQCCEKKYGNAPISVPSYEIESCVCCRDMKSIQ